MLRLIAVAALTLTLGSEPGRAVCEPIPVMTYNILVSADVPSEGRFRWSLRRSGVIDQIQAIRPSILGLQEVSRVQKADLRRTLRGYKFEGIPGETSNLAVDTSVFRISSSGSFWLAPKPFARSKGWDAAYTRTANWAHLVRKSDGRAVLAINTHLDNVGRQARIESIRQILEWLSVHKREGEMVVLMGDLNALPDWPPIQELAGSDLGLRDARQFTKAAPTGPEGTVRNHRADYIFVSPTLEVVSYAALAPTDPATPAPSDHLPVFADLNPCAN